MSGPATHIPRPMNAASAALHALEGEEGWAALERLMQPAMMPDPYRPADNVLMELGRYAATAEGQQVLAWLHAITDMAPYPNVTAGNIEHAALAAARHEGRAIVGQLVDRAVKEGTALRARKLQGG